MEVYALDSDFQTVTVNVPYFNLQWNRKYYEAGDFSMEVDASYYDPSWAYIGTSERPELGMVQKIEYSSEGTATVQVSGFFYEKRLDDKVCYPRYVGNASTTEQACRSIISKYKEDIPIELAAANSPMLGDRTQSDFSDDDLGTKLYSILETRELSQRIEYDYENDRLIWSVWQGKDRTQDQSENPWATFSTDFGNVKSESVTSDDSDYKNYCIIPAAEDDAGKETITVYVDLSGGGYKRKIVLDKRSSKPEEDQTDADFRESLQQEGLEKLLEHQIVQDVDIDSADESGYNFNYDLGDLCDILIPRVGLQMQARIVEVSEVFKSSGHSVTLGFGNKRISNLRRAMR